MEKRTIQEWTEEQKRILASDTDIRINAVAGSGKTSTMIAYAASRPGQARILYLAFNKSVKQEAIRKFKEQGLHNVQVHTAHSLAYSFVIRRYNYRVRTQALRNHEIVELLQLQAGGEKHMEYILATHINRFITYFCNSAATKVSDLNYLDTITDAKVKTYVKQHYRQIEHGTRLLLAKMDSGQIEIIHDFYLKKFQLSQPQLSFDYILFDEGQDASAAMLDIFLRQEAIKVIVGDSHQQIYSWRYAINSLEQTKFQHFHLNTSFRFYPSIAELAMSVLAWKERLGTKPYINIIGKGNCKERKTKATLARTNLGLLLAAVEYISDPRNSRKIYFEGNIQSYTYADDGASLYDVLALYQQKHDRIRDPLIQSMQDITELEEYVEKTEDPQLSMMIELVKEYEWELPGIIAELKDLHIGDDERQDAAMIFSTVHRAKGMEYDEVFLVDDFINEKKMDRWEKEKKSGETIDKQKWNEEINLLYVAITRAKHFLHIPEALLPEAFPPKTHIKPISKKTDTSSRKTESNSIPYWKKRQQQSFTNSKNRFSNGVREKSGDYNPGSGKSWTDAMDMQLRDLFDSGISIAIIAEELSKTKGEVYGRLKRLGIYK